MQHKTSRIHTAKIHVLHPLMCSACAAAFGLTPTRLDRACFSLLHHSD